VKRLRELEAENAKLKRMYADLALENAAITDVLARNNLTVQVHNGTSRVSKRRSRVENHETELSHGQRPSARTRAIVS